MLEFIRKRAQGFFAWLIVGGIIVTFALFGVNEYFSGGGDSSVAKVNGQGISQGRLDQAYFQQRQRLEEMFGGNLPEMFTEKMLKQQVLSQLIAQEVMVQAAMDNGIRVSDAQLATIIRSVEAFQVDGKFSRERYEQLLRNQGQTPASFEAMVRRDILTAQFESGYRDTGFVTRAEEDQLLRLSTQQRDFGYLQVALAPFEQTASVTDEEVEQFYRDNADRFVQPERVRIDYLELKADELGSAVEVDEETLRSRYEAQKINYTNPEERKASHILIQAAEDAPGEQVEAAQQKAEALLQRIRQGEDFATLAKEESDDTGSAQQGGDLGFFGRGAMVPEFEEAAFALGKGEVSELVRSPFGFHIIQLVDVRGGEVQPFSEVREDIRKEFQAEQAAQRFYDMAEQLANLTYEHPDSLQLASEELGLPVQTSDFFTRQGGTGVARDSKVIAAAFTEDVLSRGNNSELIELGRNHSLVLRINEHQPEQQRPLEEVRAGIVTTLKRNKARAEAEKLAASLQQKVIDGESPEKLAETDWVSWHEVKSHSRNEQEVDETVLERAFSLPTPTEEAISSANVALRSGDQAVILLYGVTDGDPDSASEDERRQVHEQLLRAESDAVAQAVMDGIRSRMEITIKN
ncbi:MAG: SurA N-terminal domain-containing protein [Gammaproteobacteria bacterium]|nr:SurA N-terminal domain-containing protein [Gammaproteobacteria bacterium]MCW8927995.1 SurA N-terminal domain-containing protein [Gammaproteobacteria bacterium]MCW8958200.1 SurA N-terminal domain-containing protein [Gammaproteobacteria bacterium]MCW8972201.1 SurA N-terminal domain-containing protein [Gammaproteobacteria bacterium]MCW8993928.1 SurA N-terminal domain-containing protein [Gammaproteobacteria bacterium]